VEEGRKGREKERKEKDGRDGRTSPQINFWLQPGEDVLN